MSVGTEATMPIGAADGFGAETTQPVIPSPVVDLAGNPRGDMPASDSTLRVVGLGSTQPALLHYIGTPRDAHILDPVSPESQRSVTRVRADLLHGGHQFVVGSPVSRSRSGHGSSSLDPLSSDRIGHAGLAGGTPMAGGMPAGGTANETSHGADVFARIADRLTNAVVSLGQSLEHTHAIVRKSMEDTNSCVRETSETVSEMHTQLEQTNAFVREANAMVWQTNDSASTVHTFGSGNSPELTRRSQLQCAR